MNETRFPKECEGLGCLRTDHFIIGTVSGINDSRAELVKGFEVTRHEVALLVEHYFRRYYSACQSWAFCRESGSTESRVMAFAGRRMDTLREVLGEQVWNKEFRAKMAKEEARLAIMDAMSEAIKIAPEFHEEMEEKYEAIEEQFLPEVEAKWLADDQAARDEVISRVKKEWLDEVQRLEEKRR